MSEVIRHEIIFFGISLLVGSAILLGYDVLRAIRRVWTHNNLALAIEDFLYWSLAGIAVSVVVFKENSGNLRGFFVIAVLLGMIGYHQTVSKYIVLILTQALHTIFLPILFLSKKMRKNTRKTLKNRIKEVRMIIMKK